MTRQTLAQTQQQVPTTSFLSRGNVLQRKCESCGNHTIAGGECADCAKKKSGLQRKLAIGASNDPLELEADRVADQVMATPAHPAVSVAPPRIQRFTGQMTEGMGTAPASVDRVLSSPGRPLEPALQQDMGQRFGHDFSRVRVHTDAAAERSAWEVNANAYTVGHNIVFGVNRFAPGTHEGRRLIAHELTHVLQQSGSHRMGIESQSVLRRQQAPGSLVPTKEQIREIELLQLSTLPHLALKQWKTLTQSERDQVKLNMLSRYGAPFTSEFLNYANGVKKPKPGLAGTLKGPEYTAKWLFDRGYRYAYGEIWVRPSGEYLMVLPPEPTKAAKDTGQKPPTKPNDMPNSASQAPKDGGNKKPDDKPEETYEFGGVTYYKSGKIAFYPKSMTKCILVPTDQNQNTEEDCSDSCVEKIPASDVGCLNLCISHCQEYY